VRRVAAGGRRSHIGRVAVSRPTQREFFFRRGPTKNLCALARVSSDAARVGVVDVAPGRDRPASERNGVRGNDRPGFATTAQRRAWFAEHGSGRHEAAAERGGDEGALEHARMVEGAEGLALPDEHTGHPEAPRAAHQFVAGHARAALDESRPHESASGLVHPRRVGDLAATAAATHGDHGKPQVQQSGGSGFSGPQPVRYGHEAEAMMSQPSTKIFLCTSEPHAAKWISDTIGEQEIERIRESRTNEQFPQSRKSKSYNLEREIRPLVMASEISGLEKMHGYLKCGNLVARLSLPYIE